jgi:hypothetical protein
MRTTLNSIFPRQNHLFQVWRSTVLTQVLYYFITFIDILFITKGFRKSKELYFSMLQKCKNNFVMWQSSFWSSLSEHIKEGLPEKIPSTSPYLLCGEINSSYSGTLLLHHIHRYTIHNQMFFEKTKELYFAMLRKYKSNLVTW